MAGIIPAEILLPAGTGEYIRYNTSSNGYLFLEKKINHISVLYQQSIEYRTDQIAILANMLSS